MVKGNTNQTIVHYKGTEDDYIVFVDDVETYKKWQGDKSVALAHFISAFKIFTTNKHGAQGPYNDASKATLHSEFGETKEEEDIIKQILEKGTVQEISMPDRQGPKNESMGTR